LAEIKLAFYDVFQLLDFLIQPRFHVVRSSFPDEVSFSPALNRSVGRACERDGGIPSIQPHAHDQRETKLRPSLVNDVERRFRCTPEAFKSG
jgi:hypothetical protein